MACYKNETKHKASKVVMIISIAAIVMGFLTAVFGAMKSGDAQEMLKKASKTLDKETSLDLNSELGIPNDKEVGALIIAGGVFCIIVGVLGGLTVKFKKFYFAVPFVGLAFIIGLLLLIGAALALGPKDKTVELGCEKLLELTKGSSNPADVYSDLVDRNMCSDVCPCDESHQALWADVANAENMKWKPAGDKVYTKFKDCYEANSKVGYSDDKLDEKAKEWFKTKGVEAIQFLEEMYKEEKCASMCKTPQYYFTRGIEDGPPKTDCFTAVVESMQSMPAGAIALLSGLALIVAGVAGFPLCTGFNEKNDEPE